MPFLNTDIPELKGFDTGLCLSNLELLGLRQNRLNESILAVLSELAEAMIRDAEGDPDTVDSILLSLRSAPDGDENQSTAAEADVHPCNRELVRLMSAHTGLGTRLLLYRMIEEALPAPSGRKLPSPLPASVRGRIAYMPGALADKAYLRLAAYVKNPRAAAFHSFVDACEEVHGGLCEYCILPLENTHSGRLNAFTRLILRYRLRVVTVCDLENGAAEGQITRFALLCAAQEGSFPSAPTPTEPSAPLYLELIHFSDSLPLTELLLAAEFCGLSLCRADTLPRFDELEWDDSMDTIPAVACIFSAPEPTGGFHVFRRFLELEAPEDIPVGLYTCIP